MTKMKAAPQELTSEMDRRAQEYFDNVSQAVVFVFKSLLNIEAEQKKKYSRRLSSLPNDIIITLDFKADMKGFFAFFLSLKTALEICARLSPELGRQYFEKEHLDVIGEIGNLISGNAIGRLKSVNSYVNLSTPHLSGFHEILTSEKSHWIYSCNYNIEVGQMGILMAVAK